MKQLSNSPCANRKREEGMAILMVLGIVAATTLLATHMMTISETLSKQVAVNVVTSQLAYECESATDMALWMHLTDRRLVTNRSLGGHPDTRAAFTDLEPWMMDGQAHPITDSCEVYINDAIKQFSVENVKSVKDGVDEDDAQALEDANAFIDTYQDYVDRNDLLNLYGMEREEYAQQGFPTLPRNGEMQFKEELFWLPNWANVIKGDITIIPPKGLKIKQQKNQKPNFFTASEDEIRQVMEQKGIKVSDLDIQRVIEARKQWQEDGTPLEDLLDGVLMVNLKNYFSFNESDYAEITAQATAYQGTVKVTRTIIKEVNMSSKSTFADRSEETLSLWEVRSF